MEEAANAGGLGSRRCWQRSALMAKHAARFGAWNALFEASGVDLTHIPGIDTSTALKLVCEMGSIRDNSLAPSIFFLG